MFVYIGKYPGWYSSSVYHDYMNKKYGSGKWSDMSYNEHSPMEKFMYHLENTIQTIYNVTINKVASKLKQKICVRIQRHDLWSLDRHLAYIILPALKELKKGKVGAPNVDDSDVPDELMSVNTGPKENEHDVDSNWFKRWDYVVDEMIFAFENIIDDSWEDRFFSGTIDFVSVPKDRDGNVVGKNDANYHELEHGPNHTVEIDSDGMKAYNDRIQNGLILFAKYYRGLWV